MFIYATNKYASHQDEGWNHSHEGILVFITIFFNLLLMFFIIYYFEIKLYIISNGLLTIH